MVCRSFFGEQWINCWFACAKWGFGMEIENKREKI
jgi:hypothetical protein